MRTTANCQAAAGLLLTITLVVGCSTHSRPVDGVPSSDEQLVRTVWMSSAGERLIAVFDRASDTVNVTLPDGRSVVLARAISGSGARYTNGEEVFWEHQGTVTYKVGGRLVFEGTRAASPVD